MPPNPPTGKEKCGRMLCSSVGFGYGAAYCAEELPCRFHTKGADGLTDIDRMLNAKNKELKKDNPVQENAEFSYYDKRFHCEKCWHINIAHITSKDYCKDTECECHVQSPHTDGTTMPVKGCNCVECQELRTYNSKSDPHIEAPMNQGYLGEFLGYEKNTSPIILKGKSDPTLEWEKDFWAEIKRLGFHLGYLQKPKVESLRDFIRALLLSERSRIEREVEAKKSRSCDCEECFMHNSALDMVLSLLRDNKK